MFNPSTLFAFVPDSFILILKALWRAHFHRIVVDLKHFLTTIQPSDFWMLIASKKLHMVFYKKVNVVALFSCSWLKIYVQLSVASHHHLQYTCTLKYLGLRLGN